MNTKKYDYSKVEQTAGIEYKFSMLAVGVYIALHLGYLNIQDPFYWIISTTGLAIFIWWSFRAYFVQVNDTQTAKWLMAIIGMYALFGGISLFLLLSTNLFDYDYIPTLDTILHLTNIIKIVLGIAIITFMLVCIKIVLANRHHVFSLKRIAISALIFIPIYMVFNLVYNVQFLGQMADLISAIPSGQSPYFEGSDGYAYKNFMYDDQMMAQEMILGPLSSIFSGIGFLWNLLIMIPYYFLFFHFYKADRANTYLAQ